MPTTSDAPRASRTLDRRSSSVDAVRVLATATVVAAHAFGEHAWVAPVLVSWHVPVFCVLSGYLWSERRTFGDELRRRTRQLLVPYLAWLALVTAAWWVVAEHRGAHLGSEFLGKVVRGGSFIGLPYSTYWFITALFFAVLYARLLRDLRLIALVGVAGLVAVEIWPTELRETWFAAGLALPCLAFLAAGIALRRVRHRITAPVPVGVALLAAGIGLLATGIDPINVKQGNLGTPGLAAVAGTAIALGLVLLAESVFVGRLHHVPALSVLATAALPVVLGHALVLAVFADVPHDAGIAVFLLALVGPWACALVAARIGPIRAVLL